ncbi:ribonuclease H-like domain-containing protein [Tanacetum coccineum]
MAEKDMYRFTTVPSQLKLNKSSTNKVKSGFTGAYSTCTPSTSSTNILEKEVLAGFADEVIYSLFAKQSEDWDLLHEDLEQIDDVDIEEMDINWQIAMIAIRMKKFYKKTGRRVRVDGKTPVGFDKKKLECFNCHNIGHFAREYLDKDDSEGSDEVSEQDDSVTGTKIPINPVPVAMKVPSIATYKIIKQGEKGVYQIVREDGTDIVYGMDGPEDELEKVFWKYLKNMFEEPLSTDPIWSLLSQQKIINKKLQGGKPDEDCYKMLKMMEKQAGIKK